MKTTTKFFWLPALIIFTSGCSTIQTIKLPGDESVPGEWADTNRVCRIGDKVTLELCNGRRVTGAILEITDLSVSLQEDKTHVGYEIELAPAEATQLTTVPRGEIVTITKKVGDSKKSIQLVALIGIAVIGVASTDFSLGNDQWDGTWEGGIMTP